MTFMGTLLRVVTARPTFTLLDAIQTAQDVHHGQKYGDRPYIVHPLAVMHMVADHGPLVMQVAVMHDVVEDSHGRVTVDSLRRRGLRAWQCRSLDAVTRRAGEPYLDGFIERIAVSGERAAVTVKRADLTHNLVSCDASKRRRYEKALARLDSAPGLVVR